MSSTTTSAPPSLALTTFMQRVRQKLGEHTDAPLWAAPSRELTELVQTMETVRAQFDAAELAVIREVDRRQAAKDLGASSTTSWLRSGPARMSPRDASRTVRLGRELDQTLHLTRAALAGGKLSVDHAAVIAYTIRNLPKQVDTTIRAAAEQRLVKEARTFNPTDLAILGKTILDVVAPEVAEELLGKKLAEEEKKANRARTLTLTPDRYGTGTHIRGKLDPETTEMLKTVLDPLAAPRPKDATGERDGRSYAERMGDALHELLKRTLNRGDVVPTNGGNRPQVVITVDGHHWLTGTGYGRYLASQQPVSMNTLYRLACDAIITVIERATQPGDLKTLTKQRKITGHLRRLAEIRDKGCAFPDCDRPPSWTDAHHIIPWHHGGPTCLDNICLLCEYHHRLIHQQHWTIRINPHDQLPEFLPPAWIDQQRKPLRNTRLQI